MLIGFEGEDMGVESVGLTTEGEEEVGGMASLDEGVPFDVSPAGAERG